MNDLWSLLPPAGWQRLAGDAAWQSTVIIAVGLLAARLVRRRAAARAAILLAAGVLSLAAPLGSAAVRWSGGGWLAPPQRLASRSPEDRAPLSRAVAGEPLAWHSSVRELPPPAAIAGARRPASGLFVGWLAVSALLAFRLLRGLGTVRRWIRRAGPCDDPRIAAAMARAASATGVEPVPILRSGDVSSPALVVLGRPRLLVPAKMPRGTDWFAVFCHELAHHGRGDNLSRSVIELAATLLPWQPLLWFVRSGFRAASEEACDDWAVAAGADPVELASLLVALVPQRRRAFALAMADGPKATRRRVLRLVDVRGVIHPRLGWTAAALGGLVAASLAIGLAFWQFGSGSATARKAPPEAAATPRIAPWRAGTPTEKDKSTLPTYIVEAPDILRIEAVRTVPKSPYQLRSGDSLEIEIVEPPVKGNFVIGVDGRLSLGPTLESLPVAGLTLPEARLKLSALLARTVSHPRFTLALSFEPIQRQISGERLVGPDGLINLGTYGAVRVAGLTIAEAKAAIEAQLSNYLEEPRVSVDVFSYNSKVYYVITEGARFGDSLTRVPITGNETVLDALANVDGLNRLSRKKIWIARPTPGDGQEDRILPVNWSEIVGGATAATNYQVLPGDRIMIADELGPVRELVSSVVRAIDALTEAATAEEDSVEERPARVQRAGLQGAHAPDEGAY